MYDEEFESISKKPLTNWKNEINKFEINTKSKGIIPNKNEEIKTYLKNRILFYS